MPKPSVLRSERVIARTPHRSPKNEPTNQKERKNQEPCRTHAGRSSKARRQTITATGTKSKAKEPKKYLRIWRFLSKVAVAVELTHLSGC